MDANVRDLDRRTNRRQRHSRRHSRCHDIRKLRKRRRRAKHNDGDSMLTRIARFEAQFVSTVRSRVVMVLVSGQAVMVLGMVVIDVRVDVQRRDLARCRSEEKSNRHRYPATHTPSLCDSIWQRHSDS